MPVPKKGHQLAIADSVKMADKQTYSVKLD